MSMRASAGLPADFIGASRNRNRRFKSPSKNTLLPVLAIATGLLAPAAFAQTPPPNDDFINAISIPNDSSNVVMVGSNEYATKEWGEPDHAGDSGGRSVWWTWQAPATGYVVLSTRGSTSSYDPGWPLDTVLGVYVGDSIGALTEVASNDEDPANFCTSRVGFKASAGTLYRIAVDGYSFDSPADADSGTVQLTLTFSGLAPNDDFAQAIQLTGTNVSVAGNNDSASKEPGEPNHAGYAGGKSVWWYWQAPATGYVTLSTGGSVSSQTGSDLDALLGVYLGSSVSNLTKVASGSGARASATFRVDAGKIYRIAVDGFSYDTASEADSGSIQVSLNFSVGLPSAPAWGPIPDIYGNMVKSSDFAGKVVVLNFWATWCSPCVAEIPDLVALYQNYGPDGLVVVGVSMDNSPDGVNPPTSLVSSFASAHRMNYPLVMDRPYWRAIESAYGGIPYIPATFIIDRQGRIYQQFVGSQAYSTFQQAVLPLLYDRLAVNLTFSGGQAHLRWPATHAAFVLESAGEPDAGTWTPVTVQVQSDGVNQFVDLPVAAGRRFFRLRSQ